MKKKNAPVVAAPKNDDGYTIPTRIKPYFGRGEVEVHGELNFSRRPTRPEHVAMFHDAIDGKSEKYILDYSCQTIALQIVNWDAVDEDGAAIPLTKEGVGTLHWRLITRLRDIICLCSEGGDAVDEAEKPQADDELLKALAKNS